MELVRVSQRHVDEFKQLWHSQKKGCAICGQPFTKEDYAVVDHDHDTGVIRGCLHNTCNRAEGELVSLARRMSGNGDYRAFLISVGSSAACGRQPSSAIARLARYTHKGVSVPYFLIGLANYLIWHSQPRTRMIHPSHRFPSEGGNMRKPNPRFKTKWRKRK